MRRIQRLILGLALAAAGTAVLGAASAAPAAPVPAFVAHYTLLRNGSAIGTATLTLARGAGDTWTYTSVSRGTSGLASLLSANVKEQSTFQWVGDLPQGDSYDYNMSTALKQKHRSVRFDWGTHTIEVDDHGIQRFATVPGVLERHTVPLALAAGLASGKTSFDLPVAVRDRVQLQHYRVRREQAVTVKAGTFQAADVVRTDGGDAFEAWFAPRQLPVPVKIDQHGKDQYSLELDSWSAPPTP